jgi:transcriptional regulator of acetoin/glycerol metabolism
MPKPNKRRKSKLLAGCKSIGTCAVRIYSRNGKRAEIALWRLKWRIRNQSSSAQAASLTTATSGRKNLLLKYSNRHGMVTGATGTGKTVTLQILAEAFSNAGVPVFCADIKGDLSGIAMMGEAKDFLVKRAEQVKLDPYEFQQFPVIFWDLFGEQGHPIRATISEMGPLLLSRLLT